MDEDELSDYGNDIENQTQIVALDDINDGPIAESELFRNYMRVEERDLSHLDGVCNEISSLMDKM